MVIQSEGLPLDSIRTLKKKPFTIRVVPQSEFARPKHVKDRQSVLRANNEARARAFGPFLNR